MSKFGIGIGEGVFLLVAACFIVFYFGFGGFADYLQRRAKRKDPYRSR